ncbi:SDR family NAD(P)-dependent oxidoreductase [Porcipelethomonas ammoniilytica]|mgnify:FL=1|uniref:SDR family NAD(P)-dependent oxidoreductase n=1 Tax=Porcipelethomonas ammoniilytica TaxID=2981722 RepID=UPI0008206052|nr:SDR family NAD(P)-dependent oxidoreductase [Porcipelethomonas ammoniilytica]MCU6720596.1 SDR family NAD(P)-dependent oxidoreductase [Porcipelethomonas ammoniilytica]SCJ18335.1 Putative ketoacyl reductase [uncultured Ruminococcus sp.]
MKNVSIVTGGASGLGKEVVRLLVQKGENVCIIARDITKIKNTVNEIGGDVQYFAGDVSDESFITSVFSSLKENRYYVNYLYNCAGKGIFGAPEDMRLSQVMEVFNSNAIGLMNITYEACRNMTEGGTIVNVMSTAALKGNANESLYCASKWAARGFTEALRAFYKKSNIYIIGVYPGGINTPFWSPDCGLSPDVSKFMDPAEVAATIVQNVAEKKTMYSADITLERL